MVLLLMGLVGLGVASGEDCDDFHAVVETALDSLWMGDVSAMHDGLQLAEQRLQCSDDLSQDTIQTDLGRFYLLQAYSAHLNDRIDERSWWLQQAVNLEYWDPNFGPEMEGLLSETTLANLVSLSTIPDLVPNTVEFRIDGKVHAYPLEVSQGLHWVEVYQEGSLIHTEYLDAKSGSFVRLPIESEAQQVEFSVNAHQNRIQSAWLGSGVLFATAGLSSHMMAMLSQRRYPQSESLEELDGFYTQTWRWGQGSLVAFSVAGLCGTMWAWNQLDEQTKLEDTDLVQVE